MNKIFSRISNAFFTPASPESLAFFRIAVSAFALVQLFVLLPDWMWLYGPKGLLPWQISDALSTSNTPSLLVVANLLAPLHISADATVYIVTTTYLLSLIGLLAGFKARLMGVLAWLMHIILNTTGHFTAYGVETFLHIALFYCMVLPVGYRWSIDARKQQKEIAPYLITLSVRLIQLHLCIMYFACGIEKAMGAQWWNGEAVWMALQQDQFHQVDTGWMTQMPIIPKLLCWGTLLVETLYPFAIFYKRTKKFWLISIISMHAFIAVFLGLELFGALMILLNLTAFGQYCFPKIFSVNFKNVWAKLQVRKMNIAKQVVRL